MSSIQLFLLGPVDLRRDGRRVELRAAKAAALLAYLAVSGTPQSRDHLADLLWPDSLPDAARKNLRNTLWAVRKALGAEVFVDGDADWLALSDLVWTDVRALESAAGATTAGDLQAAIELYRGPLLDGLLLSGAPDLEIWLVAQRERLEQAYLRLLERLMDVHRTAANWPAIVEVAGQALAVDDLLEPIYQTLMEAHARLGQRAEALRAYERLRSRLALELGVEPLPETEALRRAILDGDLLPSPTPPGADSPRSARRAERARLAHSPFVGRQAELAALNKELALAAGGQARVVVISGELGIGKSRLWQAWSAGLPPGAMVLDTRCLEATQGLPFAPLTHLFHQQVCLDCLYRSPSPVPPIWLAELSRLMPEIRQQLPDLPAPVELPREEERRRILEAFTQVLRALHGQPLVLFVDDAHWTDRATLDWLAYLVDRMAAEPLLLVVAYRPCEASAALERVVASWNRAGIVRQLPLASFTLEEAMELLGALGADPALAESLHARSAGNPYFLAELRHAPADDVPPELAQLLRARLDRLPAMARQVLQAAAILDANFEFATLRRTSGRGEEETLDALDALLDAGVLVERDGRYNFVHPLVATVVGNDLSIARRSFLHRRAAEVLENTHAGHLAPVAGQLARHYARAGHPAPAAHYAEMAAEQALSLTAVDEAVAFYRQALTLEPTPARRLGLGRVLYVRGDLDESRKTLNEALAGFEAAGDGAGVARACLALAESYLPSGQGNETIRCAERALDHLTAPCDPADLATAHYLLGAGRLQAGGSLAEAETHLAEAAQLAAENDLSEMRARSRFELGNLLAQRGDLAGSVHAFERSLALSRQSRLVFWQVLSLNNLAYHAHLAGDLAAAKAHIQAGLDLAEKFSMVLPRQYLYSTRGEIALAEGQIDEAESWLRQALAEAERHDNQPQAANIRANLGLVAQARGELDGALELLQAAYRVAAAGSDLHLSIKVQLWLAELRLARGEGQQAEEMLARANARLAGGERRGLQAWAARIEAALQS